MCNALSCLLLKTTFFESSKLMEEEVWHTFINPFHKEWFVLKITLHLNIDSLRKVIYSQCTIYEILQKIRHINFYSCVQIILYFLITNKTIVHVIWKISKMFWLLVQTQMKWPSSLLDAFFDGLTRFPCRVWTSCCVYLQDGPHFKIMHLLTLFFSGTTETPTAQSTTKYTR